MSSHWTAGSPTPVRWFPAPRCSSRSMIPKRAPISSHTSNSLTDGLCREELHGPCRAHKKGLEPLQDRGHIFDTSSCSIRQLLYPPPVLHHLSRLLHRSHP